MQNNDSLQVHVASWACLDLLLRHIGYTLLELYFCKTFLYALPFDVYT